MATVIIYDQNYTVDNCIEGFEIYKKPSSNVEFFGISIDNRFFIQFKTGSYIFDSVPVPVMQAATTCESIGKYFFANIKGKYPSTKIEQRLVKEVENA